MTLTLEILADLYVLYGKTLSTTIDGLYISAYNVGEETQSAHWFIVYTKTSLGGANTIVNEDVPQRIVDFCTKYYHVSQGNGIHLYGIS